MGRATQDVAGASIGGVNIPDAETKYDATHMGVFVGYELPIMLRAWATYFFDSNWDIDGGAKTEFTTIARSRFHRLAFRKLKC